MSKQVGYFGISRRGPSSPAGISGYARESRRNGIKPNLPLLQAALIQPGPWKDQDLIISADCVKETLNEKVRNLDWEEAAQDVERFLNRTEKEGLKLWSAHFFSEKVGKLF